ncbi:MAG: DUF3604 domain-containing protein [Kineosporiaceae bacterium]
MADLPRLTPATDPTRRSRLGSPHTFVVHADLHNHTLLSDGRGDPATAFAKMRAAGLDVAALTDHASIPFSALPTLDAHLYPDDDALAAAYNPPRSFDAAGWAATAAFADAHDVPGEFTAIRGFEWTEPWAGHVNVWFSSSWLPVTTPGDVSGLHAWLAASEPGALFGYNHPGREPGRLGGFARPEGAVGVDLTRRMVAMEAFNRSIDFLFVGTAAGRPSPFAAILDAGWRPGVIGSSDEHGRDYGLVGKGRTGVWVSEHTRDGVAAALRARATFATREVGLRLDATLDGARMGSALPGPIGGRHRLRLDVAGGGLDGRDLLAQVLVGAPGAGAGVDVVAQVELPGAARAAGPIEADVDLPEAAWALLRVADPSLPNDTPGPAGHPANVRGVAYASPWWGLTPDRPR